jgi:hypothetical protein
MTPKTYKLISTQVKLEKLTISDKGESQDKSLQFFVKLCMLCFPELRALTLSYPKAKTFPLRDFLAKPLPLLQTFSSDFEHFTLTDLTQMAQAYKRESPVVLELSGREMKVEDYSKIREEIPENVIIVGQELDEDLTPLDVAKLLDYI